MNFNWQQASGIEKARQWLRQCASERKLSQPIFRVFGYAGTGKTTVAKHLASGLSKGTAYCAFTGKAALMLSKNGCDGASTIHSLIYRVVEDDFGNIEFVLDPDGPASDAGLIVVDECSMVDERLAFDLMSYGVPIIVLGDPAQLPPVGGPGYFINSEPDVMLTEIHRQAEGNPIIRMATTVRESGSLDLGEYGASSVIRRGTLAPWQVAEYDQILVGKNATRQSYNRRIRAQLGFNSDFPQRDDRLICLRNDKQLGIFNGGLFRANSDAIRGRMSVNIAVQSEDFPSRGAMMVKVRNEFFNGDPKYIPRNDLRGTQQFDYGYAMTVHKSQGSQWDNVIVYDESQTFREDAAKWLYTAITRAADRVTVVI